MKVLGVLVFACAAISCVRAQEDKLKTVAVACQEEVGASDDDLAKILEHKAAESHDGKCLRSCVMKKTEMMNDEGKMNTEGAISVAKLMAKGDAEKEKLGQEIVETCAEIEVPEDHCEAAEAYLTCFKHESDVKGFTLD